MVPTHLPRDVCENMLHERRELTRMFDPEKCVDVIAHRSEGKDSNAKQGLGASQDSQDQIIGSWIRPQ